MADPVKTPSETPNQPVVETPAAAAALAAAAKPADPPQSAKPTVETPPAAKAANPAQIGDAAAATPGDTAVAGATEFQAKALADAAAAKTAADAAAAAANAVPENYDIKLPELLAAKGLKLDPELLPALTPALKKAGLTQSQLQAVAESFLTFQDGLPERMMAADLERTTKDPDIGGMKYGQTIKHVEIALAAFADPEFQQFVKAAGIGNRLEFVRVFQRIGEAMARSGDTPNRNAPDGSPQLTRAQRMYGGTSKPQT